MIDMRDWTGLAERIVHDTAALHAAYVGRPNDQILMRECIKRIQNEWFVWVRQSNGRVSYALSAEALRL